MKFQRNLLRTLLFMLVLLFGFVPPLVAQARTRDASSPSFTDGFDSFNTTQWHKADGWDNGGKFACGWRADHAIVSEGKLTLLLDDVSCPDGCSGQPYASGEYRTNGFYHHGTYTVVMKAAASPGVVSSFFIYTDHWDDGNPHDEIDIEILGKDTTKMQVNYFTAGVGGHETMIDLGFDAAADFHTYSIIWMADSIEWLVDGLSVHTEVGSGEPLPSTPGRIMMNLWAGTAEVNDWLGEFVYTTPLQAQYDSVSFEGPDWPFNTYLPLIIR